MENASKALLIASGILFAILILSLLIYARGKYSEFYNKQDELQEIEDIAKFNLQFTNYQDRKVHGYEIISLANKIADYNNKHSNHEDAKNNEKYPAITMQVNLNLSENEDKFKYENEGSVALFTTDLLIQNDVVNNIEAIINIEKFYGNSDVAQTLAKSINSLILTESQLKSNIEIDSERGISEDESEKMQKKRAVKRFNEIVKEKAIDLNDDNIKDAYNQMVRKLTDSQSSVIKYYEYYQFKRGIFKCTGITYNNVTGRVEEIYFDFTGEIE